MLNQQIVDQRLRAMAHAGRRSMVQHVLEQERPSSEMARIAGLSRPAATQHLAVLLEAGLVQVRPEGRRRLYRADREALDAVRAELAAFWAPRLARLKEVAE